MMTGCSSFYETFIFPSAPYPSFAGALQSLDVCVRLCEIVCVCVCHVLVASFDIHVASPFCASQQ